MIDMQNMPDKLMTVKTDPALKNKVEAVAINPRLSGSINARNLLDAAFNQPIAEKFDFPVVGVPSNRIMNELDNDTITQYPTLTTLYQLSNYPNPFNESTTIKASLPSNSNNAYLVIHDLTGREIYRKGLKSGENKITIGSNMLQKGIYIYHIEANGNIQITQKLVKMK